jgi:hypothetical protein
MPADGGVRLDEDEGIGPALPDLGQGNPESAVKQAQAGPWRRSGIPRLPFPWIHPFTDVKRGLRMKMWRRTQVP